jgi:hypothetical protein
MMKYIASFLSGLAGAILFTVLYNNLYNQTIGVVQMDELIGSHIEIEGVSEMSEDKAEEQAAIFAKALDISISEISKEYRVLLLVGPAVISPGPDYTDIIKQRIKLRMKKNG